MTVKKAEQGFFKKFFGKKNNCCSLQIEEIRDDATESDTNEEKKSERNELTSCCQTKDAV